MRRQGLLLIAAFVLALSSATSGAWAQIQVEGRGTIPYDTGLFSSKPDAGVRQAALAEAKKNALSRYAAGFSPAKFALFQAGEPQIYATLDQYVIDAILVDEGVDKEAKTYYAVIRATVNGPRLEAVLNDRGVANAQSTGGKGTAISYLFVARETESAKAFDTRRTVMAHDQNAISASQSQGVSGGQAKFSESREATRSITTGGSTLHKADEVTYRVTSPENINAAMNDVLASKGFEVYDYRDVVSQCAGPEPTRIYAEFANSDELSRETRANTFAAARQCQISVFATGTLDVGLQDIDPVTGNKRVYVSVRSQLLDITGRLPRIIASVGPVQYAGLGPDAVVAMRNALQLAATEVAKSISDQMNAKGAR
jgi:hypothetical protein